MKSKSASENAIGVSTTRVCSAPPRADFQPQRGRPTADQAVAITASILRAATGVFLAKGFEAATMEAVAEAARVPRSTLYKRFPTKLSLMQAVARERVVYWEQLGVQRYTHLAADLETRLRQHAEQVLVGANSEDVQAFMRLTAGTWEGAAEVRKVLSAFGYGAMVTFLEAEILSFRQAGKAPPQDARSVAEALMAMLSGWLAARVVDGPVSQDDARAFAHRAVELLLHGGSAW